MKKSILILIFISFVLMLCNIVYAMDKKLPLTNVNDSLKTNKYLIEEKYTLQDIIAKLEEVKEMSNKVEHKRLNKELLLKDIDEIINNLKLIQ